MTLRIVRLGTPRAPGEGPRIGTVRRPPRGVPKLAELSHGAHLSVGCCCEHEARCHRAVLRPFLAERAATLASGG